MGTVTEMMETGSNDVLVVKANAKDAFGKQERLIPFLYEQVVKRVDLTTKTNADLTIHGRHDPCIVPRAIPVAEAAAALALMDLLR